MKISHTTYKHATPRTRTERSSWKLDMGNGVDQLLMVVAKLIQKFFGLLYLDMQKIIYR